jgi:hypothetical protein
MARKKILQLRCGDCRKKVLATEKGGKLTLSFVEEPCHKECEEMFIFLMESEHYNLQ